MRRNRKQTQSSPILRLLKWWTRELADMVPDSLRPRIRPPSKLLWAQVEFGQLNGQLNFWRWTRGGKQSVGQLPLDAAHAIEHKVAFDALRARAGRPALGVALSAAQVLRKPLELPLAAAQNLRQVLAFELGRQTPFTHDQAYFDARVISEDRARQTLQVELVVAPKQQLEDLNACFKAWGVSPQFIAVESELAGNGDCVNLLPPEQRPKPGNARYWGYAAMASITLMLLAAVLLHPLWQKREVAIALMAPLAQAQQRAHGVESLKQEQARVLAEYNYPSEAKLGRPPVVAMLEDISQLLPDNTWLQQLDIKAQEISLQGVTNGSSRLINLFEKSRLFEDAQFKSPLVKAPGGEERFQLAAAIKPIVVADVLAAQRELASAKVGKGKATSKATEGAK